MSMRTRAGKKISLTNYEELLAVPTIEGASDIPLNQLHEFKGYPFHVVDDENGCHGGNDPDSSLSGAVGSRRGKKALPEKEAIPYPILT